MKRLILAVMMMSCALGARAATRTWTGAANGNWSNAANWGGVAPAAGDALVFPASASTFATNNDLSAGTSFASLAFQAGYTVNGNAFTVTNGMSVTSGTASINPVVTAAGAQTWNVDGNLVFGGPSTELGTTPLTISGDGFVQFNAIGGTTASITANGTVTLNLLGGAGYTGPTTLNGSTQVFLSGFFLEGSLLMQNNSTVQVPAPSSGVNGNYSLTAAAFHVGNITSAIQYSKLTVNGSVTLAGELSLSSSFNAPAGTKYVLIDHQGAGPVSGTFAGLPEGASLTINGLVYTISYAGNDGNDVVLTVAGSTTPTSLSLASNPDPSSYGQPVTFTATITPSNATGTIEFREGATILGTGPISSGTAAFTTSALSAGNHNITAVYPGSGLFQPSTSSALPVSVLKSAVTVAVTSSANPSAVGQNVTFTATIQPPAGYSPLTGPTGSVTFFDGPTSLGTVTAAGGVATFSTSSLTLGSHTIGASYGGDGNFNSGSGSMTQLVDKSATSVALTSSVNPSSPGQAVTFTATVSGVSPAGNVTFRDGSVTLAVVPLSGAGVATFNTSVLSTGTHNITASYEGDNNNFASTSPAVQQVVGSPQLIGTTTTVASSVNPSAPGQPVTFTATVSPSGGTGTVDFADGQTLIGTGTLSGGQATFTTSALAVGDHVISAIYHGDASFSGSTSSPITQTVLAALPASVPALDAFGLLALTIAVMAVAGWRLMR